ncbi:MAG: hypothetical protein AAYR33_04600 [Acetobacteraceae bacterium]
MAHAALPNTKFDHYTIALSWLPGFCLVSHQCTAMMTHENLIGLHGAWPSEPKSLENAGLPEKIWEQRGCQAVPIGAHSRATSISEETQAAFRRVTADTGRDLVAHEAEKHLACLDLDPDKTIRSALKVRDDFLHTETAAFLRAGVGKKMSRAAFFASVRRDWPRFPNGGIVLRCRRDTMKRAILVEVQLALNPATMEGFPHMGAFASVSGRRSSCPAKFFLPDWSDAP